MEKIKFNKIEDPLDIKEFVDKYKEDINKGNITQEIINNSLSTILDTYNWIYKKYINIVYFIYFDILCILYFDDYGNLDFWKIIDMLKKISYLETDIDFKSYDINYICDEAYKLIYKRHKEYIKTNIKPIEFYPEKLFDKEFHINNFRKVCIPGTYDDEIINFIDNEYWRYI